MTLHPYDDGNGRLARAISDRALAQLAPAGAQVHHALSLSAQIQQQHQQYFLQLERCQKGTLEVNTWLQWMLL